MRYPINTVFVVKDSGSELIIKRHIHQDEYPSYRIALYNGKLKGLEMTFTERGVDSRIDSGTWAVKSSIIDNKLDEDLFTL